jgi:hypothetical protein
MYIVCIYVYIYKHSIGISFFLFFFVFLFVFLFEKKKKKKKGGDLGLEIALFKTPRSRSFFLSFFLFLLRKQSKRYEDCVLWKEAKGFSVRLFFERVESELLAFSCFKRSTLWDRMRGTKGGWLHLLLVFLFCVIAFGGPPNTRTQQAPDEEDDKNDGEGVEDIGGPSGYLMPNIPKKPNGQKYASEDNVPQTNPRPVPYNNNVPTNSFGGLLPQQRENTILSKGMSNRVGAPNAVKLPE